MKPVSGKKNALITGITGFVGSHLAEYLLTLGNVKVYGTRRWRAPLENISGIMGRIELVDCDLLDLRSVEHAMRESKPDYVFHLAAQSYVPFSFIAPAVTLQTNILGTLNVLEAVRRMRDEKVCDPVVHVCSSSEVYGQVQKDEVPIRENNPFRPASPYAVSKVGEDMLAFQYFLSYGLKTIRTRMFTHEGPRRGEVFVGSNFAKQIALIEKGKQPPVVMVGNLDSVRTFADVRDTVKAYWLLVNKCPAGEVYNIGGETTMTIREMLDMLVSFSPKKNTIKIKVDPARLRPSDVTLQIPDTSKFRKATGWKPEISVEKMLRDMLDYWRERV